MTPSRDYLGLGRRAAACRVCDLAPGTLTQGISPWKSQQYEAQDVGSDLMSSSEGRDELEL